MIQLDAIIVGGDAIKIIISEIIKKLRIQKRYTQKEVADLLGVDRSTYSYYELGRINPDIKTIMKLAEIFEVHYTEILESEKRFRFSDVKSSENKFDEKYEKFIFGNLTAEERDALIAFKLLPKDSKNEVIELIDRKFNDFKETKRKERFDSYFK